MASDRKREFRQLAGLAKRAKRMQALEDSAGWDSGRCGDGISLGEDVAGGRQDGEVCGVVKDFVGVSVSVVVFGRGMLWIRVMRLVCAGCLQTIAV